MILTTEISCVITHLSNLCLLRLCHNADNKQVRSWCVCVCVRTRARSARVRADVCGAEVRT